MSYEISILVIHGMGSQKPNFAEKMIYEINQKVDKRGGNPSTIAWEPIYWANIVEPAQLEYFRNAKRESDIDYLKLRKS